MTKKKWAIASLTVLGLTATACGAATTGSGSSSDSGSGSGSGTSASSCASSDNEFYVVENASCASGAGKLSRVNPDVPCKEEKLTELNCPVDFVLSTVDSGIGYLSSRTDGIYQVNLNDKTKTKIVSAKKIVAPAGLFLLESITAAEREGPCGGNTLVDAILMIADAGTDLDGGMIWRWCLITDDASILSGGTNPDPVSEVPPSQVKHPRGVVVKNRSDVYITGDNPDISDTARSPVLAYRELNKNEQGTVEFLTASGALSSSVTDLIVDSDGTLLIADPGNNAIVRYDPSAKSLTTVHSSLTGGPLDLIRYSTDSSGNGEYLVTQFSDGVVSKTTLVSGATVTTVTTGLTLSGPDGIAQK